MYIETETASLDAENWRSFVCIFPVTQEVFDKITFSWSSEQRVELAPGEIHFDWSNSLLLEADVIVGYCSLDVLAQ